MNIFQRALFKRRCITVPEERDEAWKLFLANSSSQKKMRDYITDIGGYYGRHRNYPLEWDVSAMPDLLLENFKEWYKEHEGEFSVSFEEAEKYKLLEAAHEEDKENLWGWGIEDARSSLTEDDTYKMSRFNSESFDWKGWFEGRGGKHFVLDSFEGDKFSGMSEGEFEEYVEGLSTDKLLTLFIACVEFSYCLRGEAVEKEVQYRAFWTLGRQVKYLYEDRGIGEWEIKEDFVILTQPYFRVCNKKTGEQSMLGSKEECEAIVKLAESGELKGSFGLMKESV